MEIFSALLAICAGGIHRSPVTSPHKGQWCRALMFSLICVRINGWVNNREAGDFRRYHAHYDVTVMNKEVIMGLNQVMYITWRGTVKTYTFLLIYLWWIWDKGLGRFLITIKNIFFLKVILSQKKQCSWYYCIMQYISHHLKITWIWTYHHQLHDLNILWNQKLGCHWSVINVIKQK